MLAGGPAEYSRRRARIAWRPLHLSQLRRIDACSSAIRGRLSPYLALTPENVRKIQRALTSEAKVHRIIDIRDLRPELLRYQVAQPSRIVPADVDPFRRLGVQVIDLLGD